MAITPTPYFPACNPLSVQTIMKAKALYIDQMSRLSGIIESPETLQQTNDIGQSSKRKVYTKVPWLNPAFVPRVVEVRLIRATHEIEVRETEY